MSATATLAPTQLAVTPGGEVTAQLRVRNTGDVVDELSFGIAGPAGAWTVVEPPSLSLLPGSEGDAVVRFRPPLEGAPPAGPTPFAVVVSCHEDPTGGVAEEGSVDVQPVVLLAAELVPRSARAARKASFQLAVDNRGNTATDVAVDGQAAGGELKFDRDPAVTPVAAGGVAFVQVEVRPAKRFWRGPTQSRPFQVVATPTAPEGTPPVVVEGTMVQEPLVPKWAPAALAGLLAAILALVGLWFSVLRPTVESAAEDAVEEELAEVEEATEAAEIAAEQATQAAAAAQEATTPTPPTLPPIPDPTGGGGGGGADPTGGGTGSTFDRRLTAGASEFTVPGGQTLRITDVVFGNPDAESGTLTLRRDGEVLLEITLANFRDFDYHFITPIVVPEGGTISAGVACFGGGGGDGGGNGGGGCTSYVYLSGQLS